MNESDAVAARIRMTTQRRLVVVAEMRGGMRHTHTHIHTTSKRNISVATSTRLHQLNLFYFNL